jgi:hypothetical protein
MEEEGEQQGEHHRSPVGKQYCSPVGKQHLESLDYSDSEEQHHPREDAAAAPPSSKGKPRRKPAVKKPLPIPAELSHETAAASPEFVRAVEAAAARKLSRGDLAYCTDLERRGLDAEKVCAAVIVGRARKLASDTNRGISDPARSLRYFANCIEEAANGLFPAGYVDQMRHWLIRHGRGTIRDVEGAA